MKAWPIPGGRAAFDVATSATFHAIGSPENFVGFGIAVAAARLFARHGVGDVVEAAWRLDGARWNGGPRQRFRATTEAAAGLQ